MRKIKRKSRKRKRRTGILEYFTRTILLVQPHYHGWDSGLTRSLSSLVWATPYSIERGSSPSKPVPFHVGGRHTRKGSIDFLEVGCNYGAPADGTRLREYGWHG